MSSILIGGVNETGDWVYNPTIDDYEWVVTGGQGYPACPECCECPAPVVEKRSRSASKSKCGYIDYGGDVNKRYSTQAYCSGESFVTDTMTKDTCTVTTSSVCTEGCLNGASSGGTRYGTVTTTNNYSDPADVDGCPGGTKATFSHSGSLTITQNYSCSGYTNASSGSATFTRKTKACPPSTGEYDESCTVTGMGPGGGFSSSGSGCYIFGGGVGTWQSTYSNPLPARPATAYSSEYTTATLISNTVAALTSYTGAWSGSPTASRNLSSNELSYAIAESQYRFRFKVPKLGRGTTYIIKWVERFSPEGGGAVTDTVKTFTWGGTIPGGYDATDSTTWPLSDEYTMAIPATDGTVALACITATCTGTAPSDPCNP